MCGGGGGSAPVDNSLELERLRQEEAEANRQRAEQERLRLEQEFQERLSGAYSSAMNEAQNYFTQMGLDPQEYLDAIAAEANRTKQMVPMGDQSPFSYFDGLGQSVFGDLEQLERTRANRELDRFAGTGFDSRLIDNSSDDSVIQAILAEQEAERTGYADNLLARGVVTNSGYQSALDSIANQRFGVQSNIDEIARAVLESGRGNLRDIATSGRQQAGNLNLGQMFDPTYFEQQISDEATNFLTSLGDNVRSRVGENNLFDLSSILSNAGRGQGAQNTAFDPAVFFGQTQEDEEDENANFFNDANQQEFSLF